MLTTLWHHDLGEVQWTIAIGAALAGAIWDLSTRRIPNLLTGPVLLAGLAWASWIGGLAGLADATVGCLLLALPYVLLFVFAGGGAGDAKLMGAIGAWLGVLNGVVALVSVAVCGAVLAVAFALAKKKLRHVLANLARMASIVVLTVVARGRLGDPSPLLAQTEDMQTMPYGVGIFAGVCVAAGGVYAWGV